MFGWGVVAPGSRNVDVFAEKMREPTSFLRPFDGFGPSNFLVGQPDFEFDDVRAWIDARFPPSRSPMIARKFGTPTHYALSSFIQALSQNPGIEAELRNLGTRAQVILGSGLTDLETYDRVGRELDRAKRRWNRFWAQPTRNEALAKHVGGEVDANAPKDPAAAGDDDLEEVTENWHAYWAQRSSGLAEYLEKLRAIEAADLAGEVASAKAVALKNKQRAIRDLRTHYGAPDAPWDVVSADLLWNIASTPSAQISMLGHITGMSFSPLAACSAFGFSLKLGIEAIQRGEAKMVVIGATEPAPHPLSVGTFYNARVLSHDGSVSKPLTGMRGTHVAGGSAIWIIGDLEHGIAKGFRPLGLEPVGVGISSDADHIITPSKEGPITAVRAALADAGVAAEQVAEFDMHATGTPGDFNEVELLREVLPASCRFSARKGGLGHGMGAGGGWELTAQYLGVVKGQMYPTNITPQELNPEIRKLHEHFIFDRTQKDQTQSAPDAARIQSSVVGKLSMGVGGLNVCVISRPYESG